MTGSFRAAQIPIEISHRSVLFCLRCFNTKTKKFCFSLTRRVGQAGQGSAVFTFQAIAVWHPSHLLPSPSSGAEGWSGCSSLALQNTCLSTSPSWVDRGSLASHVSAEFIALDEKCMASSFTTRKLLPIVSYKDRDVNLKKNVYSFVNNPQLCSY
jgi:hypothetical protein